DRSEEFGGGPARIGGAGDRADDGDAVGAGVAAGLGAFGGDAADGDDGEVHGFADGGEAVESEGVGQTGLGAGGPHRADAEVVGSGAAGGRSEEHTSELQSRENLVCRLLLGKK